MNRWLSLAFLAVSVYLFGCFFSDLLGLHESYYLMLLFFIAQTFVLFGLDLIVPEEWSVQLHLVKIILRFLLSAFFIVILIYTQEDRFDLVIQFMVMYFIFMVFEIVASLTNLRKN